MKQSVSKILLSDLLGCKIVTAQGKTIGHVLDIQLTKGSDVRVQALMHGRSGLFHRLHMLNPFRQTPLVTSAHTAIPWEAVDTFTSTLIRLKPDFDLEHSASPTEYFQNDNA